MTNLQQKMEQNAKFTLCDQAEKLRQNIEVSFLALGETIKKIRDNNAWEGKYEDFADFVENGLKMNQGTASKLVKIYETFVEKYNFPREKLIETSWTHLYQVIPLIENKEDAEEWIDKASTLTRTDLGRCIKEKQTGRDMGECEHDYERIIMLKCKECGKKIIKYE